jgi:hypothetical protein
MDSHTSSYAILSGSGKYFDLIFLWHMSNHNNNFTIQLLPLQTIRKEGGDISYINILSENFIVVSNAEMIQTFSRDPDRLVTKSFQSPAFDALRQVIYTQYYSPHLPKNCM